MPNPKLAALTDSFTAAAINTALWNSITGGAAVLDTVNDLVALAVPTVNGATNTFGTTLLFDATSSSIYAQIGAPPNGNGGTKVAFKLQVDANNSVALRVEAGAFKFTLQTAGVTTTTTLPAYDPHAHRWWRIRETGGSWAADTSPDGLTWTQQTTSSYSWAGSATAMSFLFQTGASVTEAAGSVATIEGVNTPLGGQFNPNWPLIEDAWGAYWTANAGDSPLDRYVEVTDRTRNSVSISRGRQYELDQVRSGEASMTLANTDAALDPGNASGPWFGHIAPYQPYRRRAQWPATRNLLEQVAASGGDLGGYPLGTIPQGSGGVSIFSVTDNSGGSFVSSASAWQGSTVMQFAVPSGSTTGTRIMDTPRGSVIPGQAYTLTLRVRDVTASTSLSVQAFIGWYTASTGFPPPSSFSFGSSSVLTGSTTAGWTTVTVTATAPANAAGMDVGLALAANAAATCNVQVDGVQLEKGSASSAWACPGVWYPMYAGYMERWPSNWDMAGTYGLVQPQAVDAFSLLSQKLLSDPLTQEINNNSPRFVFKLDDPAGSTAVADWTGNYPAAQLAISKYGAGSLVFGTAITATDPTGIYTGSSGSVATFNNANPGSSNPSAATFIQLSSAGITGPADVTQWTRMIAFRYMGPTPASGAMIWTSYDKQRVNNAPGGSGLFWFIDTSNQFNLGMRGPGSGGATTFFRPGPAVNDGDWHLAIASYSHANAQLLINLDGVTYSWGSFNPALEPTGLISDNVGANVDPTVGNGSNQTYKGDVSFLAEFPTALNGIVMNNLYNAWRSGCAGESTDARYARILRYAGYTGPSTIQAGLTRSMGPAAIDGQDAVSALQSVVDTEGGEHFVDRSGFVQFKARSARYNAVTPVYVFGERTDLGEWPYEDVTLDYDSTHLSNQVTVTQASTNQNFYAQDPVSIGRYFPRSMSRTLNSSSADECQDAANYLLSRYKQPATRVSSIKLHPSAQPALWPVCLSLELGLRVRIMRRPPNLPTTQIEAFIEQLQWDTDDTGDAWVTLQCSPADTTPYAIFSSLHTTLNGSPAAGVTTITLNAGPDNTNPAAAQIGQGQQLVLGLGTANQETVTVLSVAGTSPGWSTVAVTLQAATTKSHSNGDVVCEPLPARVTDPTAYDANSKFDAVDFAY
ncbi:hypothetical protein ACWDA7_30495 [Streptomyces sp. NPDC001156]